MKVISARQLPKEPLFEGENDLAHSHRDMSLAFNQSDRAIRDLGLTPYDLEGGGVEGLEAGDFYSGKKRIKLLFGKTETDAQNGTGSAIPFEAECLFERDCRNTTDGKYTLTKIAGNTKAILFFKLKDMDAVPEVGKKVAYRVRRIDNQGFADPRLDNSYGYVNFVSVGNFKGSM